MSSGKGKERASKAGKETSKGGKASKVKTEEVVEEFAPEEDEGKTPEPTAAQLKQDVHELLVLAKNRAAALTDAYSIMDNVGVFRKSTVFPDLRGFTPHTASEVEIQCFNTTMLPPHRFLNAEAISDWLMEPREELNRRSVAVFLSQTDSVVSRATLETLANKVCLMDKVAHGSFVEALKVFLPASGCLDLALDAGRHGQSTDQQLTLLRAVALAFLQHSKGSLSSSALGDAATGGAAAAASLDLLVRLGTHVLASACAMLSQPHVHAELRDEFRQSLELAHDASGSPIKPQDRSVMTAAFEAEMFSGRPILPMPRVDHRSPSYLFARPVLTGWATLRLAPARIDDTGLSDSVDHERAAQRHFLVLTHNALYCFEQDICLPPSAEMHTQSQLSSEGNRFPRCTIPLAQCNAHANLQRSAPAIELTSISGDALAVLKNALVKNPAEPLEPWWGVSEVVYQSSALIEVDGSQEELLLQPWLEAIDEAAWTSRK